MKETLKEIVIRAILSEFDSTITIDKSSLLEKYPFLKEQKASFVTLNINNNLRGCIGSIIAHRSLLEDLIHNAKAAAFEDPRFIPLSRDEFDFVDIEISLLTTPVEVNYIDINDLKNQINIGEDGIILKSGYYQSTFLPQVWESLSDFDSFFYALCQKAGLRATCLERHPSIYKYNVISYK
ncbi:MAG: AmmeMemoRadiSam system protein A [Arcobacteraceae bacterium]|jgi:AmmeMemoRadiSam system protein A|nr:AmmeMemoRadiSam system protein A [Arcobacteraceae bacterium]MDY0365619.1 AmmeMemoRadiSam system protein A [Arcobacteraceae bacterium]